MVFPWVIFVIIDVFFIRDNFKLFSLNRGKCFKNILKLFAQFHGHIHCSVGNWKVKHKSSCHKHKKMFR